MRTTIIILIVLFHTILFAEIFFWVDENGVKHFSNAPHIDPDNKTIQSINEIKPCEQKSLSEYQQESSNAHEEYNYQAPEQKKKSEWHINLCKTKLKDESRWNKRFAMELASLDTPKNKFSRIFNDISISCMVSNVTDLDTIQSAFRDFHEIKEVVDKVRTCRIPDGNVWRTTYSTKCINGLIKKAIQLKEQGEARLGVHPEKYSREEIKRTVSAPYREDREQENANREAREARREAEIEADRARREADQARREADWAEKKAKNGVFGVPQFILERKAEYSNEKADRAEKKADAAEFKRNDW